MFKFPVATFSQLRPVRDVTKLLSFSLVMPWYVVCGPLPISSSIVRFDKIVKTEFQKSLNIVEWAIL